MVKAVIKTIVYISFRIPAANVTFPTCFAGRGPPPIVRRGPPQNKSPPPLFRDGRGRRGHMSGADAVQPGDEAAVVLGVRLPRFQGPIKIILATATIVARNNKINTETELLGARLTKPKRRLTVF